MTRAYDTNGFREIGANQTHARTEYQYGNPPKHVSAGGTGPEVRTMLVEHAGGKK